MDLFQNLFRRLPAVMKVVQVVLQTAEIKVPFIFDNVGANTFTIEEEKAMLEVVRARFGPDVSPKDLHVVGCGTIGRVFRYKDYALKVKIPGVLERIERDLAWIENIALTIDVVTMYRFFLHRKIRTVHESICRQNDFAHELQNAMQYTLEMKKHGIDDTCIFVPTFYPELSSDDMVVMAFVEGRTLAAVTNPADEIPERVREELHKYLLFNLTLFKFCHADLHVGNIIMENHTKCMAIIDFGMCTPRLSTKKVIVLLKLMQAAQRNDAITIAHLVSLEYFVNNDPNKCVINYPDLYHEMEFEIVRAFHRAFDKSDLHKVHAVFRAAADWSLTQNVWGSREMAGIEIAAIVSLTNLSVIGIKKDLVRKYAQCVMQNEGLE
jgi:hypothetical protein